MAEKQIFTLAGKEAEDAETWIEEHKKTCNDWRPAPRDSGEFSFRAFSYEFREGNCGTAVSVRCTCGATEDVTDYESF